jgi:hypothetical protein
MTLHENDYIALESDGSVRSTSYANASLRAPALEKVPEDDCVSFSLDDSVQHQPEKVRISIESIALRNRERKASSLQWDVEELQALEAIASTPGYVPPNEPSILPLEDSSTASGHAPALAKQASQPSLQWEDDGTASLSTEWLLHMQSNPNQSIEDKKKERAMINQRLEDLQDLLTLPESRGGLSDAQKLKKLVWVIFFCPFMNIIL